MNKNSENKIYLSYKNICLYNSDISTLNDYNYLNDMSISFYFEFLNNKFNNNLYFLFDPASISMIIFDDEISDLYEMFLPLNLNEKEFLFFPINDNNDKFKCGGGSHWALLIYQKSDQNFYYLDSMCSYIENVGVFVNKIKAILNYKKNYFKKGNDKICFETSELSDDKNDNIIVCLKNKLQLNSYDCGIFVLEFTERILNYINSNRNVKDDLIYLNSEIINNIIVKDNYNNKMKRQQILNIVEELRNQ